MSTIQQQIQEAESIAEKELNLAKDMLKKKYEEASKKALDIFASAKKDADASFISKKELLGKKLDEKKLKAEQDLLQSFKDFEAKKSELIKKGVSFLLSRLTK